MPIGVSSFPIVDNNLADRLLGGFQKGQQLHKNYLANELAKIQNQNEQTKSQFLAPSLQEQLQKAIYENQIQKPMAENADQFALADLQNKQAQAPLTRAQTQELLARVPLTQAEAKLKQFQVNNPLLSLTGTAGQVGALAYIKQHPELFGETNSSSGQSNNYTDLLGESLFADLKRKQSITDLFNTRNKAYSYANLPPQFKNVNLAQAKSLGYGYDEASKLFNQGYTVQDLAKQKGFDPNNLPLPEFAPTPQVITQYERSNIALQGLNEIEPDISKAIKPYSERYKGYSFSQIADAVKGENIDQQAKFLAARALQPEIAALRIKASQGQAGITAINETIEAAQNTIKTLGPTVKPEVYQKMNEYINQWLNRMNHAERKALTKYQNQSEGHDLLSMSEEELLQILGDSNE